MPEQVAPFLPHDEKLVDFMMDSTISRIRAWFNLVKW
jgi:hypothetical protein